MALLKGHEIAEVLPMLRTAELQKLADDIKENGLLRPVVLFEGKILDGRNRYTAARVAGYDLLPKDFIDFEGDWLAAVRFVTSENLARRHLTSTERAVAAERLATLAEGRPVKDSPKKATRSPKNTVPEMSVSGETTLPAGRVKADKPSLSVAEAAALTGSSPMSVHRVRKVKAQGAPEVVAAVESGALPLRTAVDLAELPKEQQTQVLAAGPEAVKEATREVRAVAAMPSTLTRVNRNSTEVANRLMLSVRAMEEAVILLLTGQGKLPAGREGIVNVAAERLAGGAQWLLALASGEYDDAALNSWLGRKAG